MSGVFVFFQQLVSIFSCSRRNSSASHTKPKTKSGVIVNTRNKAGTSRQHQNNTSTDLGCNAAVSHVKPPPGLSAPPGLELPVGDPYEPRKHDKNKCIDVEAKACVSKVTIVDSLHHASCENDLASSGNVSTDAGSDADGVSASGSDTEASVRFFAQKSSHAKPPPGLSAPPGLELPVGDKSKPAVVNASGPDTESSLQSRAQRSLYAKPPPGLSPPPGLEPLSVDRYEHSKRSVNKCFNLNAEAKAFVPKATSWDQKLEECLRDITASSEKDLASSSLAEVIKRRIQHKENALQENSLPRLDKIRGNFAAADPVSVKLALKVEEVACVTDPPETERANITEDHSLRSILEKLAGIDAGHIFMVKKVNKLGLGSVGILKAYFSNFGRIENVYVTHIPHKRIHAEGSQARPRIRAPGVGFVIMEKIGDVAKIFQNGLEHTIADVRISLEPYEHHIPKEVERNSPSDNTSKQPDVTERPYINFTKDNTFRSNMSKMAEIDESRIIMVRKINKLGLGSAQSLETHFGQIGNVTNVFVAHGIDRNSIDPERNPHGRPHIRSANLGFVVMEKADDVSAAFQKGCQQAVCGVNISLVKYKRQVPSEAIGDSNELESSIPEEPK